MTRYELHVQTWKDCTRCEYSSSRKGVVFGRGKLPADILFVGEAPGESEDVIGVPFVGQAGRLLDVITESAGASGLRTAYTNLVGCIPKPEGSRSKEEPDFDCVHKCGPRLIEWGEMCSPKLIVCVGKQPAEYLDVTLKGSVKVLPKVPRVAIAHPASILRAPYVQRGLMVQRCVVTLRKGLELVGLSPQ